MKFSSFKTPLLKIFVLKPKFINDNENNNVKFIDSQKILMTKSN